MVSPQVGALGTRVCCSSVRPRESWDPAGLSGAGMQSLGSEGRGSHRPAGTPTPPGPRHQPPRSRAGTKAAMNLRPWDSVCAPLGRGGGLLTVSASPWDSHASEVSSEPHTVPGGTGEEHDLRPVTPPPAWSSQSWTDLVEGHTVTTRRPRSSLRSPVSAKDTEISCLWYVISGGAPNQGVSCSHLAGNIHHLLEPSEANIHHAQLFWGLPERKAAPRAN